MRWLSISDPSLFSFSSARSVCSSRHCFPATMFSRVFASGKSGLGRIVHRSAGRCSRSLHPSARAYSTGAASCTHRPLISHIASPFQIGCAVAAGLGCGAALLYGNRLFAVEVGIWNWILDSRIRSLWAFPARTPTVLASSYSKAQSRIVTPACIPARFSTISCRAATS